MVFNINNNTKCFLSSKSAYSNDFCETEDWSNDAENSVLSLKEQIILKMY